MFYIHIGQISSALHMCYLSLSSKYSAAACNSVDCHIFSQQCTEVHLFILYRVAANICSWFLYSLTECTSLL
uniref:Uncharacterized protein n=1 Tax=Arundo donax TaxID=35708 RepID=A0A0A9BD18_ARUDO